MSKPAAYCGSATRATTAARQRAKEPTICVASVQVKAAFRANQSCYGSRRVVDELKAQGMVIGR
ncbi:MAG: hypothetical protein ABL875_06765, partial [Candidatus Nitrotoga sp.]